MLIFTPTPKIVFILVLLGLPRFVQAQRVFVAKSGSINRTYINYTTNGDKTISPNLPVVVVLPPSGDDARKTFASNGAWLASRRPAVFLFPNPGENQWRCADSTRADQDTDFIDLIIKETYSNFHIDRNRVYLLGNNQQACLIERLKKKYPHLVAYSLTVDQRTLSDSTTMAKVISELLAGNYRSEADHELWKNVAGTGGMTRVDSIKEFTWHRRIVLEFRPGLFFMNSSVKTGITDKTYMDISNSHSTFDIHLTKWVNDSIAWFVDIGRLKIPQKQEIDGDLLETGGGMVFLFTAGFKYALPRHKYRPYISLGTGVIPVMIFGGKLSTLSMGSGSGPPSSRPTSIKAEARVALHTTLETGFDWRFGKRLVLGGHLRYIHSGNFDTAGKVNGIKGLQVNGSVGYIFNANRVKNLPFAIK